MRAGACTCGDVRYTVDGPVRDVLICHCDACIAATGGPWAASAARREDLVVADDSALAWERAAVSEYEASRGHCLTCGTVVFWDGPGRPTLSFAADTLADPAGLEVAAHIWVGEGAATGDGPCYPAGLPASVTVPWRSRS